MTPDGDLAHSTTGQWPSGQKTWSRRPDQGTGAGGSVCPGSLGRHVRFPPPATT